MFCRAHHEVMLIGPAARQWICGRRIVSAASSRGLVSAGRWSPVLPVTAARGTAGGRRLRLRSPPAPHAARDQGDTASAVRLYTQAVELNPQWPDGWWFLGVLQYGANQFAPARDALTHFIELKPNAGAALALRGLCEFETGQFNESLGDIQHGITLGAAAQPRNAEILLYHEALLLTRLGYFEEAIGKYTNFVKQGKTNPELTTAIGLAGLRMPVFPQDADPAQAELIAMTGSAATKVMGGDMDGATRPFRISSRAIPSAPNRPLPLRIPALRDPAGRGHRAVSAGAHALSQQRRRQRHAGLGLWNSGQLRRFPAGRAERRSRKTRRWPWGRWCSAARWSKPEIRPRRFPTLKKSCSRNQETSKPI